MAKSSRMRRGTRVAQTSRTGGFEFIIHPRGTWLGSLIGRLVRLRAELFVLACLVLAYLWLSSHLPTWGFWATVIGAFLLVTGVTPVRRYVIRRGWCVISRHRTRACFRSTWTMTYDGTLPYLLWSRPTPVGERIRVWLPAGLSVQDLERVSSKLASACWAHECRVEPARRASAVVLHIVRRDPLRTSEPTPDVLGHINPRRNADPTADTAPLPQREEVTHEVRPHTTKRDTTPTAAMTGQPSKKSKNTNHSTESKPVVEGFGGMDVSDYV